MIKVDFSSARETPCGQQVGGEKEALGGPSYMQRQVEILGSVHCSEMRGTSEEGSWRGEAHPPVSPACSSS
jgi:hypothetical protein